MGDRDEPQGDVPATKPVRDVPITPDEIVDHARLIAQARGKALLPEMIAVLDDRLAQRLSSARASAGAYGDKFDWDHWGRITYVLESTLAFLERLDGDNDAKTYLARRFRYDAKPAPRVEREGTPDVA